LGTVAGEVRVSVGLMRMVYVLVTVAGVPALSVTVTTTLLKVPAAVGVPEIAPVLGLMANPAGNTPPAPTVKWYGDVPPPATMVVPVV